MFIVHLFIVIPVMLAHSCPKDKGTKHVVKTSAQKLFAFLEGGGDVRQYTNKSLAEKLEVSKDSLYNAKNVFLASGILYEDVKKNNKNADEPVILSRTKKILSNMSEKGAVFNVIHDVGVGENASGYMLILNILQAVEAVVKSGRAGYKINDEKFKLVGKKLKQKRPIDEEDVESFEFDERVCEDFDVDEMLADIFNPESEPLNTSPPMPLRLCADVTAAQNNIF